jgi:hypothetical protein
MATIDITAKSFDETVTAAVKGLDMEDVCAPLGSRAS